MGLLQHPSSSVWDHIVTAADSNCYSHQALYWRLVVRWATDAIFGNILCNVSFKNVWLTNVHTLPLTALQKQNTNTEPVYFSVWNFQTENFRPTDRAFQFLNFQNFHQLLDAFDFTSDCKPAIHLLQSPVQFIDLTRKYLRDREECVFEICLVS